MSDPELILSDKRADKAAARNERAMHAHGSCDQCKFCGVVTAATKEVQFICRKKPPTVMAQLIPTGQGQATWMGTAMWPSITKFDWCGEFSPTEH